jgi:hypothetical protein
VPPRERCLQTLPSHTGFLISKNSRLHVPSRLGLSTSCLLISLLQPYSQLAFCTSQTPISNSFSHFSFFPPTHHFPLHFSILCPYPSFLPTNGILHLSYHVAYVCLLGFPFLTILESFSRPAKSFDFIRQYLLRYCISYAACPWPLSSYVSPSNIPNTFLVYWLRNVTLPLPVVFLPREEIWQNRHPALISPRTKFRALEFLPV